MAGVLGIEPRLTDLESVVLPLNYTPTKKPLASYWEAVRGLRTKESLFRWDSDRLLLGKRFFSGFVLYW